MKISYNWLQHYLQFSESPEKIGELLTNCGLEVEGIERVEEIPGGLRGLVVGEVVEKQAHPNADKLSLTQVVVEEGGEPLSIVCGAPNVEKGRKVIVAVVGTTLHTSDGESFKIKKSKIRGEVSEGMICAEDEIGMGESHDGIMVLDTNAQVGTPAADYFQIKSDYVFEIGLTPNRADAMSHYGVARDLAAVLNRFSIDHGPLQLPTVPNLDRRQSNPIDIEIKDTDACPRYVGVYLKGVKVAPSPDWLQKNLLAIGLNPINNIVDITNFVLHELGQPLHAFDADKIKGNKVVIQTLPEGSPFITLDEVERKLNDQDLMICNDQEGMCIAGVFGGLSSGVTESTQNVFLESAYFNPVSVRKTAKRHGLNTDASFRFERGIDPDITVFAAERAAELMREIAGAEWVSEVTDVYPNPQEGFEVNLRYENADQMIGKVIDRSMIRSIITDLGMEISKEHQDGLELKVPAYKVDVTREIDVIEEILRVYGYNEIEDPAQMRSSMGHHHRPDANASRQLALNFLASNGFSEMMSNSLTKAGYYEWDGDWKAEHSVQILNPLSSDLNVMRQSMLFNGLEAIQWNQNRNEQNLRLVEYGKTYHQYPDKREEVSHLALFQCGQVAGEQWNSAGQSTDFYQLKGMVISLIQKMGLSENDLTTHDLESPLYAYGMEYRIKGKTIAQIGEVSNAFQKRFDLRQAVYYADVHWDNLFRTASIQEIKYKDIPKFPSVRRDLALLVDRTTSFAQIESIAWRTEKKLLERVFIFDVYQGKGLAENEKSYAVGFEFRDPDKTLTDKVVDKAVKKIYGRLEHELQVKLRSGQL